MEALCEEMRGSTHSSDAYAVRLEELRRRGIKRILSSDCHSRENLLFGFEEYAPWLD